MEKTTYCPNTWSCYIIVNDASSYVGVSTNPERRLLQHNAKISGGAKYTLSKGPNWSFVCIICGFDKISSLQFEWAIKHCSPKHAHGLNARLNKLFQVLNRSKWTKNSINAKNMPLILQWYNHSYRPKNLTSPPYVREVYVNAIIEENYK